MKKRLFSILLMGCCLLAVLAQKQVHIISANDMHANIQRMPQLAAM